MLQDAEARRFRAAGYLIVNEVVPRAECVELKRVLLDQIARGVQAVELEQRSPAPVVVDREKLADVPRAVGKGMLQDVAHRDDRFMALARDPRLTRRVAPILGHDLALYRSLAVFKPKEYPRAVGWHQDMSYWRGGTSKVSLWLALDDVDASNGAMRFVPGTHELAVDPSELQRENEVFSLVVPSRYVDESRSELAAVGAGGVVLFDSRVFHGSLPNTSGRDRYALVFTYQPGTDDSHHRAGAPVRISVPMGQES